MLSWHKHARFFMAFAFGLMLWAGGALTPLDGVVRALIGVNGFFLAYLGLMLVLSLRASADDLRRHAEVDDEGAALILVLAMVAIGISLTAIFMVLNRANDSLGEALFALAAAPLGWATLHVMAAFRYAHLYYAPDPDAGLQFPGDGRPGIVDFLSFSFTIGMTAQVSDVVVTTGPMRRVVLVHGVGSFFYNTVILALAVNAALALSK